MRSVVEIGASVPAFLGKLWKLVNDTETNHLISWSPGGKTFIIKNQADFARELLPLYYKHNNMASFIRQLNMYGFHKITSVENGGLRYEKDDIEFSHPCFMRGHAYLLEHIKRKIANPKSIITSSESGEKILLKPELMNKVLADVKQMKGKQESLDAKFSAMKQENEALWREVAILRQKHIKQQQIVNNLIQFLMSLVQPTRAPNTNGNNVGVKRPYQLMINCAAHNSGTDSYPGKIKNIKLDKDSVMEDIHEDNIEDGPTIHELAHDDVLTGDASQDPFNVSNFVTVDMTSPGMASGQSQTDPVAAVQYHVTLEDGDDAETDASGMNYSVSNSNNVRLLTADNSASMPIVTSPSPVLTTPSQPLFEIPAVNQMNNQNLITVTAGPSKSKIKNNTKKQTQVNKFTLPSSNLNSMNPQADLKLPAEIFADDDSIDEAGLVSTNDTSLNVLTDQVLEDALLSASKDKMLGGINIKIEKPDSTKSKKSKKLKITNVQDMNLANIKTEIQDDLDWSNMTLATVNNNTDLNKVYSMSRRDYNGKYPEDSLYGTDPNENDVDDHLETMQTDLDSLRELLRSDSYAFDTSTLKGLFGADDPFYGLSYNLTEDRAKTPNAEGNQLMSYAGNLPDFSDISILPELEDNSQTNQSPLPSPCSSTLNTPKP